MNNYTINYNYFNTEQIKFLEKKQYEGITKIGLSYYHNQAFRNYITLPTPWMFIPFGLGKYQNKNNDSKYYLDLSFSGIKKDLYLQQFHNIIEKLDKYVIYKTQTNLENLEIQHLLQKKNLSKYYTYSLRYNINKETLKKETKYPPTIKLKLFTSNLQIIDTDGNQLDSINHLKRGVFIKTDIRCNGMWVLKNKFGLTWTAKHIIVSNHKMNNYYNI